MEVSVRYQYDQNVYVLYGLIDWFNKEAPPDDVGLLFNELIDVMREHVDTDDIKQSFVSNTQLLVIMPYTLKTVARQVKVKIICRFVRVQIPFSPNINFIGSMSFGKMDEMNTYLKDSQHNMGGRSIIELPHP